MYIFHCITYATHSCWEARLANFSQLVDSLPLFNSDCVSYSPSLYRVNDFSSNIFTKFDIHGNQRTKYISHSLAGVRSISFIWLNQLSLVTGKSSARPPHLCSLGKKDRKFLSFWLCECTSCISHSLYMSYQVVLTLSVGDVNVTCVINNKVPTHLKFPHTAQYNKRKPY